MTAYIKYQNILARLSIFSEVSPVFLDVHVFLIITKMCVFFVFVHFGDTTQTRCGVRNVIWIRFLDEYEPRLCVM